MASIIEALAAYQAKYFDGAERPPVGAPTLSAQPECPNEILDIINQEFISNPKETN